MIWLHSYWRRNEKGPKMNSKNRLTLVSFGLMLVIGLAFFWTAIAFAQDNDPPELELGLQVYAANCTVCHGAMGEGRVGATLAKDWPSIRPELATAASIADGVPGSAMPAWSQENGGPLTAEEIAAVVAYVLSWQTGGMLESVQVPTVTTRPPIAPVPEVEGDPNQGAVLYDYNCAVCHGKNGEGRIGATLTKNWGSIRPDLAIQNTIVRGSAGALMPAWGQENGGPLTLPEIDDIVAFVMSWETLAVADTAPIPAVEESPLAGWNGVFFTLVLMIIIIALILVLQRRKQE
jgi:cytochrome c oxidase cbb3-type subunit III